MSDRMVNQRARSRRRRRLAIVLFAVLAWLVVGAFRAEKVAREYWAQRQSPVATLSNVRVTFESPFIPPFWWVSVDGDVSEPQMGGTAYVSAMLLVVEPLTGLVLVFGQG